MITLSRVRCYIFLLIVFVLISTVGCSSGYSTIKYFNIIDGNPTDHLLTIGSFRGEKTQELEFPEATQLILQLELEKGSMMIELYDDMKELVFSKEITASEPYNEMINKEFNKGTYHLKLSSRRSKNVTIKFQLID